jgi:hypothetical protein
MSALFMQAQADTPVILALVEGAYTQKMISDLSTHDAKELIIRVNVTGVIALDVSNTV